jgi:hypothetical protein
MTEAAATTQATQEAATQQAAGTQAGQAATTTPAAGTQAATGTQAASFSLEALPEHYRAKTADEALAKVWPALDGFIKQQAQMGSSVASPDAYQWTPPEALAARLGDVSKDPEVAVMRKAAFDAGITDKKFATMMTSVVEQLGARADANGDAAIVPETNAEIKAGNVAWIENMAQQGKLSDVARADLQMLTFSKGGSEIIAMLQASLTPGFAVAPAGGQTAGSFGVTAPIDATSAKSLMSDKRYMTDGPKYDPAFRKWADDQMDKFAPKA